MTKLHVICKNNLHVKFISEQNYESGYWPVSEEDAMRLIGGMLCLHEAKAVRSYFGGIVKGFRRAGQQYPAEPERLIFLIEATLSAKGQGWRGSDHSMAWIGGIVED